MDMICRPNLFNGVNESAFCENERWLVHTTIRFKDNYLLQVRSHLRKSKLVAFDLFYKMIYARNINEMAVATAASLRICFLE